MAARVSLSILNNESPGFFCARFDKGSRAPFTFVFDPQGRVPASVFQINAGEKGLIFQHRGGMGDNDMWLAFASLAEYAANRLRTSDADDLVEVRRYTIDADLRRPKKHLSYQARLDCRTLTGEVRAIPFSINDGLGEFESERLKKAMRLQSARLADGTALDAVQEDWESGITVFLPAALNAGANVELVLAFEGDIMESADLSEFTGLGRAYSISLPDIFYPRDSIAWYPRHGYLRRSAYDLRFRHDKNHKVVATGARVREESDPEGGSITEWKIDTPVPAATFGVGRFDRFQTQSQDGVPIEFFAPDFGGGEKQTYMLTELSNCVEFFGKLFGRYPYPSLQAMFHTRGYGQGLPTMLLLPPLRKTTNRREFSFVAHEMSHQWWGDVVTWRTYRDQWLSEGFADYSGLLYTAVRMNAEAEQALLRSMRKHMMEPPAIEGGVGKGRLVDIGPLIMGHRLGTRKTRNAYSGLVYEKGALVLRMLHYLLSDPSTGDDREFYAMLSDFVKRYENRPASTEGFAAVAGEHFRATPLARKYGLTDLNWFFRQWVYQTALPSYRFEYTQEAQPGGATAVKGTVFQEDAPEDWMMLLPLEIRFGKDKVARGSVQAKGPQSPFSVTLPLKPDAIQLDPQHWVLSEDTSTFAR